MDDAKRKVIYSMLRELRKLAAQASMTGSFRKSTPILVSTYNKCLALITEEDANVALFFNELSAEQVHVDEVGAAAGLLASYLFPSTNEQIHVRHCGHHGEEHEE